MIIQKFGSTEIVYKQRTLRFEKNNKELGFEKDKVTDMSWYINKENEFEILSEEDEEIDIDKIEEFEIAGCNVKMGDTFISTESLVGDMLLDKTNKLIKAVKQLNKKIKE